MKTYQLAIRRVVNCDQILNDLIDEIDDCTEESSDDSFDENIPICNTSDDCDSDSDEIRITDPNDIRFHFKSYFFCAAHDATTAKNFLANGAINGNANSLDFRKASGHLNLYLFVKEVNSSIVLSKSSNSTIAGTISS